MPTVPIYRMRPGDRLEVEVVQPGGGRALVIGKLDAVPEGAGGLALQIRVCDAQVRMLPAAGDGGVEGARNPAAGHGLGTVNAGR